MITLVEAMPIAVIMVAGPQIITAILLAVSRDWLRNSLSFLTGVAVAVTLGTGALWLASSVARDAAPAAEGSHSYMTVGISLLLVVLAVFVFRGRKQNEPPRWMAGLVDATPRRSFALGFLLFFAMPTDLMGMAAVAGYLADNNRPLTDAFGFIAATLLLAGLPMLVDLLLGKRAATVLPKVRTWITSNSWIISEVVILFFLYANLKRLFGV